MGYRTGILIMVLIYHYHLMYYIQLLSSSLLFRVMMIIFLKQHFQQWEAPVWRSSATCLWGRISWSLSNHQHHQHPRHQQNCHHVLSSNCHHQLSGFMILKANMCVYLQCLSLIACRQPLPPGPDPLENIARIAKAALGVEGGGGSICLKYQHP